jgi:hypothetical protein
MYAVQGGQVALMEFDPADRTKRIVRTFPTSVINEVTGSDVRDADGTMYFAARRSDPKARERGESGSSRPFMIVFNPVREVR